MLSLRMILLFLRRFLRLRFLDVALCCLPQCGIFIRPVPVTLKRFAADFLFLSALFTLSFLDLRSLALIRAFVFAMLCELSFPKTGNERISSSV